MPYAEPTWSWEAWVPGTDEWYQRLAWSGHVIGQEVSGPAGDVITTGAEVAGGLQRKGEAAIPKVGEILEDTRDLVIGEAAKIPAYMIFAAFTGVAVGLVGLAVAWRIVK